MKKSLNQDLIKECLNTKLILKSTNRGDLGGLNLHMKQLLLTFLSFIFILSASATKSKTIQTQKILLDGTSWLIAQDSLNVGNTESWWKNPIPTAKQAKVPGIIQNVFPAYHGLAWYWREFATPANPHKNGRYILKFNSVDYLCDVWLNNVYLGKHEGVESPFEYDVTDIIKKAGANKLALRVLSPTIKEIDGISYANIPYGFKSEPITPGYLYSVGGIMEPVELLLTPPIRITDVFAKPDAATGEIKVSATIQNASNAVIPATISLEVKTNGEKSSIIKTIVKGQYKQGCTQIETTLKVINPRLWDVNDPFLYHVNINVQTSGSPSKDETTIRIGFRDFRVSEGVFKLNGKRLLISGMTDAQMFPLTISVPTDSNMIYRTMANLKKMGFNLYRNVFSIVPKELLDACDELGILVYRETMASCAYIPSIPEGWQAKSHWNSPMDELKQKRFVNTWQDAFRRDRNHPSIVMWGLINETPPGPMLKLAVESLPAVRAIDETRVVVLNSGANASIATTDGTAQYKMPNKFNMSNVNSQTWDVSVQDVHSYKDLPHTYNILSELRTLGGGELVFNKEGGMGAALNYPYMFRKYKEINGLNAEELPLIENFNKLFMADWKTWKLEEVWKQPEGFFDDSWRNLVPLRIINGNAYRANPNLIAWSTTSLSDLMLDGTGLLTAFREIKPGMLEAMQNVNAPLRWSLFTNPVQLYSGSKIKLEALLSNVEVLKQGKYNALLEIKDPNKKIVLSKTVSFEISTTGTSFVTPVVNEDIIIGGISGEYSFTMTLENQTKVAANEIKFYVSDRTKMPAFTHPVLLMGVDKELESWLSGNGIRTSSYSQGDFSKRNVILVSRPSENLTSEELAKLTEQIAQGSSVIYLTSDVLAKNYLPLEKIGGIGVSNPLFGFYRKDDWSKKHPIFDGLPTGGVMDYHFYRNIIPPRTVMMSMPEPDEAVAGAINACFHYSSGLNVAVYKLGDGQFIVNHLLITENLGTDPVAEKLLRNMLNFISKDIQLPLAQLPADWANQLNKIVKK